MNKRRVFFLIGIGMLVLFSMALSGRSSINLYKCDSFNNVSSTWKTAQSLMYLGPERQELVIDQLPVVVEYRMIKRGDMYADNPVRIILSDKDLGSLWFPLYCNSSYQFTVNVLHSRAVENENSVGKLNITGNINVSGNYKFTGLYSRETVNELVVEKIMQSIYEDAKKELKDIRL